MDKITKQPGATANMQTRHEEFRSVAKSAEEAKGFYTAERVLRSWKEDFIDEDTGEKVTLDRNEILMERGVYLEGDALAQISFYFQTGDITEVEISNQMRTGVFDNFRTTIWAVTALISEKRKKFYLYADSAYSALEIAKDFLEQQYPGRFGIVQVSVFESAILITDHYEDEDTQEAENPGYVPEEPKQPETYRIELEVEHDERKQEAEFIVNARDAEHAKSLIERFLAVKFSKEGEPKEFVTTLISAKVIPCEAMIGLDFCNKYLEKISE